MDLTPKEERQLLDNSIERVINTSMKIAFMLKHEDALINYEDWEELKWITVKLWNEARNEVFKKRNKL